MLSQTFTFASGGADNIKKWKGRDGTWVVALLLFFFSKIYTYVVTQCSFLHNCSGHNTPINALALNDDGVFVSCGDNGSMNFWDYETGYCFQKTSTIPQPGDTLCCAPSFSSNLSSKYRITGCGNGYIRSDVWSIWKSVDHMRSGQDDKNLEGERSGHSSVSPGRWAGMV